MAKSGDAADAWGTVERERFRLARRAAGHNAFECARMLRDVFGANTAATQSSVSRWESGAIARPSCVRALLAYSDAYVATQESERAGGQTSAVPGADLSTAADGAEPKDTVTAGLEERNSVLHEVLRLRRVIDEHQATIDRCRVLIDEQRSEIEALLLGAPAIPNN